MPALVTRARLPAPADATKTTRNNKKRLILLCDGTCEDSLGDNKQRPTNITRIARALSPNAWVLVPRRDGEKEYEEVEQIVSYQAGPGTDGNALLGAPFGTGLSEIVRSAYGFLCDNYNDGDKIYFFGFSRGAYVARSIAGLVAEHGLLSKRGMDNFHAVYEGFYNEAQQRDTGSRIDDRIPSPEQLGLQMLPKGTVEVVGVFDTVGFHNPITAWLNRIFHWKLSSGGDKNEFPNTLLSDNVKYAFHALSLDESRIPFQTTLFFRPNTSNGSTNSLRNEDWTTDLKQVWFSGVHSDIGGGTKDPRLSNISLMWMVAELVSRDLLEFDQNYLLDTTKAESKEWATIEGANNSPYEKNILGPILWIAERAVGGLKMVSAWVLRVVFRSKTLSRKILGVRTPGLYIPKDADGNPGNPDDFDTGEQIHASLEDRDLEKWPCKPLTYLGESEGRYHERAIPVYSTKTKAKSVAKSIFQLPAHMVERGYRGRVRDVNNAPVAILPEVTIVPIRTAPVPNPPEDPFRSKSPSYTEAQLPIE